MQIKLHRHFDIVLKKPQKTKDGKIFIYHPPFLTKVFPFKKKVILYISMIKTYLEKMLLKHENSIDKVVQTFSSTLKGNILFFFL